MERMVSDYEILPALPEPLRVARQATLDALPSANSRRAYARDLDTFWAWAQARGLPPLNLATLEAYKADLLAAGKAPATVNRYLSAVRAWLKKIAQLYPDSRPLAQAAREVESVKVAGEHVGHRLSWDQMQAVVNRPPADTLTGQRDRALLAVLFGCWLRRQEAVDLRWSQLRQVDGHWCFVDIIGKRRRKRTVKVEAWVYRRLLAYADTAGLDTHGDGPVFVRLRKGGGGKVVGAGEPITPKTIYATLKRYAPGLSPHDARRTGAQLARKFGAPLEQIKHTLGHERIETTERYTAIGLDLDHSATGYIPPVESG